MTNAVVTSQPRLGRRVASIADVPLWAGAVAAVAIFALYDYVSDPGRLVRAYGDSDDALRLVQVRQLLDGQSWYDTTIGRLGGEHPLVSHWSRLVDLPLALLIKFFSLFMAQEQAELVVRFAWPLLLLVVTATAIARRTEVRAGNRLAALLAIALVVAGTAAHAHFMPGRIDHHNVMLLTGVTGLLLLAEAYDNARAGLVAGFLLAFGNAVGYEALVPTVAALVIVACVAAWEERLPVGFLYAALAYTLTLTVALAATVAPSQWAVSRCDALGINLVVLAAAGTGGLAALWFLQGRLTRVERLAVLGAFGVAGACLFTALDPVCVGGPFAEVDPVAKQVWLPYVDEARSFLASAKDTPTVAAAVLLLLAYGIRASFILMRAAPGRMIPRIDFAILIVTVLYALLQVRVLSYASLIVAPPIAGFLALPRPGKRTTLSPRQKIKFAAIAVATCGLVFAAAMMIKRATGEQSAQTSSNDFRGCIDRASAAALNELPPGLILNDMDLGAHILAETRDLRVFSAPYHRIGANIAATHDIFFSSPEEARKRILATGADYVAVCPGLGSTVPLTPPPADALKLLLLTDNAPAFLERVRLKEDTPIRVWRVVTPRPLALIREAVREPSGLSIE